MAKTTVQSEVINGICVLRPNGYVDEKGGAVLVEAAQQALNDGNQKFVINFSGSPVINSQGIAQIIELAEIIVDEKGGDLGFCGLSELSAGVFKMVGLLQMGDQYDSENEALENLSD